MGYSRSSNVCVRPSNGRWISSPFALAHCTQQQKLTRPILQWWAGSRNVDLWWLWVDKPRPTPAWGTQGLHVYLGEVLIRWRVPGHVSLDDASTEVTPPPDLLRLGLGGKKRMEPPPCRSYPIRSYAYNVVLARDKRTNMAYLPLTKMFVLHST